MNKNYDTPINEGDLVFMAKILASKSIKHKYAVRILTVINRSKGYTLINIAEMLGISISSVSNHLKRYNEGGVSALLQDKTRKPGKAPISEKLKNELTQFVCQTKPESGTHWSTRELAEIFGISHTMVNTILRERNIKPHIVKKFCFSADPEFDIKLADVVGLYLNPPKNSIVFCVDEKTQIQALERTCPILPLRPGIPESQTHDYERHGTTTLFAALDVVSGQVIGKCKSSHNSMDYIDFLKTLDRNAPKGKKLHIIVDNYSPHKSEVTQNYLNGKKKRFTVHYIPTHSSWLNMIERWFAEITNKRIRRESFRNLKELEDAIIEYIVSWNKTKRCFKWTKKAEVIQNSIYNATVGL